ncbi:MAG: hypothetical protein AAF432_10890 [Planctomycetota bacterium]
MNINGVQSLQDYNFTTNPKGTRSLPANSLPSGEPNAATTEAPGTLPPVMRSDELTKVELDRPLDPDSFYTPEGMRAAIAEQNLEYDLNGNGVVNIDDMLELLNRMAERDADADNPADEPTINTVARTALTDTSAADLAADVIDSTPTSDVTAVPTRADTPSVATTIVDVLSETPSNDVVTNPTRAGGVDVATNVVDVLNGNNEPTAEAPLRADGAAQPSFASTLVDDTSLAPGELATKIADMMFERLSLAGFTSVPTQINDFISENTSGNPSARAAIGRLEDLFARQDSSIQAKRAEQLAGNIHSRLEDVGYGKRPPVNIQDIVSKLTDNAGEKSRVLDALSKQYPAGLGINLRG